MSLDLSKLTNKLDEALSIETTETLTKFLNDKRMSNNKQSSVDWFSEKTFNLIGLMKSNWVSHGEFLDGMLRLKEQAKAMHKEEIEAAYNQGYRDGEHETSTIPLSIGDISDYNSAEDYYNETFNTKEE